MQYVPAKVMATAVGPAAHPDVNVSTKILHFITPNYKNIPFLDIDCGKVSPLLYGNVEYVNDTTFLGSQIAYSCVNNYRLSGVPKRTCQEIKQWSDSTPKCEGILMFECSHQIILKEFIFFYRN